MFGICKMHVQIEDASFEFDVLGPREMLEKSWGLIRVDSKRRQPFEVRSDSGELLAMGVLYNDCNVQVLWRKSVGWTAEQYHTIAQMFGIEVGASVVCLVDSLPIPPAE